MENSSQNQPDKKLIATALIKSFAAAKEAGVNKPKIRVAGIVLYPAPASGNNPGYIYIKDSTCHRHPYLGKVSPEGRFYPSHYLDDKPGTTNLVQETIANPQQAAINYGKTTGSCSCCGRTLTNPESISLGIGPVCRANFGWSPLGTLEDLGAPQQGTLDLLDLTPSEPTVKPGLYTHLSAGVNTQEVDKLWKEHGGWITSPLPNQPEATIALPDLYRLIATLHSRLGEY